MKKTTLPAAAVNDPTQEPTPPETIAETIAETPSDTTDGAGNTDITQPDDVPPPGQADDIEARIAEAENRGYLRGRNERIAELMRQPALFERQASPSARDAPGAMAADSPADSQPMILNNPRVSIWDR